MDHTVLRTDTRTTSFQNKEQGSLVPKVFNCIVDETALVQGAKKTTRDGIPRWIDEGRVRLFVPLHALAQSSRLKESRGRLATDAQEALQWLDEATEKHSESVVLQGSHDQYHSWAEVERFALPTSLFSGQDHSESSRLAADLSDATGMLSLTDSLAGIGQSFSSNESYTSNATQQSVRSGRSASPLSPPTSRAKVSAKAMMPEVKLHSLSKQVASNGNGTVQTPDGMKPLLNYILWRVHQETDASLALETFIFLSDNAAVRKSAQRFGIRCKTLAEMRYVVTREIQDVRNRKMVQKRETSNKTEALNPIAAATGNALERTRPVSRGESISTHEADRQQSVSGDEDEILLKRAPKAPAALMRGSPRMRGRAMVSVQSSRGSPSPVASPQSRGAASYRTGSTVGRAPMSSIRGRGGSQAAAQLDGPIDPNSFARPAPTRSRGRGGRGLWLPT